VQLIQLQLEEDSHNDLGDGLLVELVEQARCSWSQKAKSAAGRRKIKLKKNSRNNERTEDAFQTTQDINSS